MGILTARPFPAGKEKCRMKKKSGRKATVHPTPLVSSMIRQHPSPTEPQGSWTGLPENPEELPVQDADDL